MNWRVMLAGVAAAGLAFGAASAQTVGGTHPDRAATTGMTNHGNDAGQAAASGNNNQAVATTSANAPQPAKGANSFTEGQAQSRLESAGYSNVSGLKKDDDGIWRGTASKGGSSTNVWVDYKGSVGQSNPSR